MLWTKARLADQPGLLLGRSPVHFLLQLENALSLRRFEFVQGGSKKFWEITQLQNTITVRFGRLGTTGQSQTKSFATEHQAQREAEKLIGEKTRKGYRERASD